VPAEGGKAVCTIKQDENDTVAYTVKTNKAETKFVIQKGVANPMYFRISPNGITGPTNSEAKVSETWQKETTVPLRTVPKIE